jgi:ABC-type hemin transport system substrate-binding protein
MTRQKRTSRVLEKAQLRAANLRAIDPNLDLGSARSLSALTQHIEQLSAKLETYNTALTLIDSSKVEIDEMERTLADLTDQMLAAVSFKYGNDSREYAMAGGTRKSDRIRKSAASRIKGNAKKSSETPIKEVATP